MTGDSNKNGSENVRQDVELIENALSEAMGYNLSLAVKGMYALERLKEILTAEQEVLREEI